MPTMFILCTLHRSKGLPHPQLIDVTDYHIFKMPLFHRPRLRADQRSRSLPYHMGMEDISILLGAVP